MTKHTTLIVGAHFRPPAKQVLAHLAGGAAVYLVEDNENAYDAAAVKVMFDPANIPDSEYSTLESELLEAGITLEQLLSAGPIQLGYVPAQDGKPLSKARLAFPDYLGNQQVRELMGEQHDCHLGFAADGSPVLHIITSL